MAFANFNAAWTWLSTTTWNSEKTHDTTLTFDLGQLAAQTTLAGVRNWSWTCINEVAAWLRGHSGAGFSTPLDSPHYAAIWWAGQGGASITIDDILNAMLAADYDQLSKFIGIEDAYRSAIWDQPFNAEFYAALARGFRP